MATGILDLEQQLVIVNNEPVALPVTELAWETENTVSCRVTCGESNVGELAVAGEVSSQPFFCGDEEQTLAWLKSITYTAISPVSTTDTIVIELVENETKSVFIIKDISIEINLAPATPVATAVKVNTINLDAPTQQETLLEEIKDVANTAMEKIEDIAEDITEEVVEVLHNTEDFIHYVENKMFGYNHVAIAKSVCGVLGIDPETITEDETAVKVLQEYSVVCWNQKLPLEVICDKLVKG